MRYPDNEKGTRRCLFASTITSRELFENVLHTVCPAFGRGGMFFSPFAEGFIQFLEQLTLVLGELDRRLDHDVAVQVARVAGADALDALATQAEGLAMLRAFGDVDLRLATERRHFDAAAQGCRGQRHGHVAVQVIAIALENLMLLDADLDVQISCRAAIRAGLAIAR